MAQNIFHVLGGGVGGAGEGPEGGHIHEEPFPKAADIQLPGLAPDDGGSGLEGVGGDLQAGGEVVGAALGQVAHRRGMGQGLKAGDDLVQCAVSAYGHHRIVSGAGFLGNAAGVPRGSGAADAEEISGVAEGGGRVVEGAPGLAAARPGIDDHQKLLLGFHI